MKVCLCNSSSVLCEYPPYPWKKLDIDHKSPYNIMVHSQMQPYVPRNLHREHYCLTTSVHLPASFPLNFHLI